MQIHQRIQSGKFPNCSSLATEIEVSSRTIKRDIDFMKYRMNLPIEYDSRRYGYYFTRPVSGFPSVPVTEAEMFSLLIAQKAVAQYRGTPFEQPLRNAFRKLSSQLNQQKAFSLGDLQKILSFRPFAPEETDLEMFEILTRALQERRPLRFGYKNLGAIRLQTRRVHPYHLACVENCWYLFAYDLSRKALRTFVLTRLTNPELMSGQFDPPKDFDPEEYLRGSFSVFKGGDDYEVVLEFDAWAADLIRGRHWHSSQEVTELPRGRLGLRLRLNNLEEILRWILSWGVHATVVRPQLLIDRVRAAAAELVNRYV